MCNATNTNLSVLSLYSNPMWTPCCDPHPGWGKCLGQWSSSLASCTSSSRRWRSGPRATTETKATLRTCKIVHWAVRLRKACDQLRPETLTKRAAVNHRPAAPSWPYFSPSAACSSSHNLDGTADTKCRWCWHVSRGHLVRRCCVSFAHINRCSSIFSYV